MDFSDLFDASAQNYAGSLLQRMFGDIVAFVSFEKSSIETVSLLSTLIGIFNNVMLLAAVVIGSFTTYTMIFDTASDGKAFGNGSSTNYTILRVLTGAIAFIPISGGFSMAQVILVWLMVQGSAVGDVMWRNVAGSALLDQSILGQDGVISESDYIIQGKFADALRTLTYGELCAMELNRISALAQGINPDDPTPQILNSPIRDVMVQVNPANVAPTSHPGWIDNSNPNFQVNKTTHYYEDTSGNYGGSANLCGSLSYSTEYRKDASNASASFARKVGLNVTKAKYDNLHFAVYQKLKPAARQVAFEAYSGNRSRDTIERLIQETVSETTQDFIAGASLAKVSDTDIFELHGDLIDEVDTLGWPFAITWYRGISNAISIAKAQPSDFAIDSKPEVNISNYFGKIVDENSALGAAIFDKVADDFGYLKQFDALFSSLGEYQPDGRATVMNGGHNSLKSSSPVYHFIIDRFNDGDVGDTAIYMDPAIEISNIGKGISGIGASMVAISTGVDAVDSFTGGLATKVGPGAVLKDVSESVIKPAGWMLLIIGFALIGILPNIPLLYFFGAVMNWLIICVESMFAIPLAVLTFFSPAREGTFLGSWNKIILNLFGIFLRPLFTIIGMVFAIIIMRVGLDFLSTIFSGLMTFLSPENSLTSLMVMLGVLSMFLAACYVLIMHASSIVVDLGDGAMNWIGITMSSIGRAGIGDKTVGNLGTDSLVRGGGTSMAGRVLPKAGTRAGNAIGAGAVAGKTGLTKLSRLTRRKPSSPGVS